MYSILKSVVAWAAAVQTIFGAGAASAQSSQTDYPIEIIAGSGHSKIANVVAFSSDGRTLVSGSYDDRRRSGMLRAVVKSELWPCRTSTRSDLSVFLLTGGQ